MPATGCAYPGLRKEGSVSESPASHEWITEVKYFRIILGSRRLIRLTSRRISRGILFLGTLFGDLIEALPHLELIRVKHPEIPFFTKLSFLLDQESEITLGSLVDSAGEQTYGLLVLLLALPSLVPGINLGAAPMGGVGILVVGVQMILGKNRPWLPEWLRRQPIHRGSMKKALTTLEDYLVRLGGRRKARRALDRRWMGLVVAWMALLLCVPVPLPFGNQIPAVILIVLGAGLLEEQPFWGWIGTLAGVANTIYFAISFKLIIRGCLHVLRVLDHWVS